MGSLLALNRRVTQKANGYGNIALGLTTVPHSDFVLFTNEYIWVWTSDSFC
ncbi:unnamed protein product [Chondrus crispus]|uniref:Uncharacterized protein n=1 Tax=Chondrus crispus TaxID=2769 RepID=R7QBR5_CHOCR|nr:unnamed protein product [Chondrus crispus]CDF35233.1 unnamed protein product [Chondrus crispus]|eukprot:XP_005715052.1 unnamed protein product [Chondrus crispus]